VLFLRSYDMSVKRGAAEANSNEGKGVEFAIDVYVSLFNDEI